MTLSDWEISSIVHGAFHNPHSILGMHYLGDGKGIVCRVWDPHALKIIIKSQESKKEYSLRRLNDDGLFEIVLPDIKKVFKYTVFATYKDGENCWVDPYSFLPSVTGEELISFNQGWDRRPFHKLGAIPKLHEGISGVSFVVWAPSAKSIHLVGDFNHWNTRSLPMRSLGNCGCWELFVPFASQGHKYKFSVLGNDGVLREKTDPFGWQFESLPGNASIIADRSFSRASLISNNNQSPLSIPISIYEMHLGSWRFKDGESRPYDFLELSRILPDYLTVLGFTHVEFLPPSEYPYGASWGYQVTGYYSSTHRYGSPEDFLVLLSELQKVGIGIIIDWVPAHFPSDEFALAKFDGSCLYEHEDPKKGLHAEWGTLCFNYGRAEVRSFLIGSAIAWLDRFGVDGFRVDAVASMLYLDYARKDGEWCPNEFGGNEHLEAIDFLKQFNQAIHEEFPEVISIAEESTSFPQITKPPSVGGLGFDLKWNMGWMHDVLGYFSTDPIYRTYKHDQLTFGAMYQFSENFVQAFSHDEVVHGKGSLVNKMGVGYQEDRIANLRALIALQWTWPGKKTLFMGCEFGQWGEWNFESQLDWALMDFPQHKGISSLIGDLNRLYKNHPTWAQFDHVPDKFQWIDCNDAEGQTLSFLRYGTYPSDTLMVVCNFSDSLKHRTWGCPHKGKWNVILDTDAPDYSGSGEAGGTEFTTIEGDYHGLPHGLSFSVSRWSVRILSLTTN
jgi:1,4-alpha-glucan branching enzyme